MSKFPDFDGIWEFPNDQNSVPKTVWKSQELGKFPTSSNTGRECLYLMLLAGLGREISKKHVPLLGVLYKVGFFLPSSLSASSPDYTFVVSSREWLCRIGSIPSPLSLSLSPSQHALQAMPIRPSFCSTCEAALRGPAKYSRLSLLNFLVAKMSDL